MAVALTALRTLDVATHLSDLKSLISKSDAYAKMGAPGLPGIPDLKEEAKKLLDAEKDKIIEEARTELIALLVVVMAAGIAKLAGLIPDINKVIAVLNKIVGFIDAAVSFLIPTAKRVFIVILALIITVVISTIILKIPSLVVAWGAGISFDVPKAIAQTILNAAQALLDELKPIAPMIISVLMMILKVYGLMMMVMGILKMFMQSQTDSAVTAEDAFNMTADDWGNTSDMGGDTSDDFNFVECTLPNGEVKQMSAEDCLAAGGTFPGMELLSQLNDLDKQINNLNGMIGACLLPDGTVEQMSPEDCAAAGGIMGGAIDPNLCWSGCGHGMDMDGSKLVTCRLPDGTDSEITLSECNDRNGMDASLANLMGSLSKLKGDRSDICDRLGDMCGFQLDEFIITSLMNPHDDTTVKKATTRTGKRKGFYNEDI
tara:strand:+ start:4231 stop:5520 length:1290 start_codon:yes stop_codon:yes gene_type:complete